MSEKIKVDDKLVRIIGIPFFGLVIPNATGLVNWAESSYVFNVFSHLYFIFIAAVIWEGNRFLLFRNYQTIFESPSILKKYVLILGLNVFYTLPVSIILLFLWKWLTHLPHIRTEIILVTSMIIIICVIFISNMYEKVLLVKHTETEKLRSAQLEKAKIQAELEALKNQIDPHFMFNALNAISYLIDKDTLQAQKFIDNLAEVYRYILKSKDKDLVLLEDELVFVNAYAELIRLRYNESFHLHMELDAGRSMNFLVPPISIMVAIENVVKHNEMSEKHRMTLRIKQDEDSLVISNVIKLKKQVTNSTKTGLKNLNERFEKLVGRSILINDSEGIFRLQLPLLKLNVG